MVLLGWRWKLAITVTLLIALYAIFDNTRRVAKLEKQVCDTVLESDKRLDELQYYRIYPEEKEEAKRANRIVLERFHCPLPEPPPLLPVDP